MTDFSPCKLAPMEVKYRCDNDCRYQGCPEHTAKLRYHSTADLFTVDFGKGQPEIIMDSAQMQVLVDWIDALNS